jgi:hypothetical protein
MSTTTEEKQRLVAALEKLLENSVASSGMSPQEVSERIAERGLDVLQACLQPTEKMTVRDLVNVFFAAGMRLKVELEHLDEEPDESGLKSPEEILKEFYSFKDRNVAASRMLHAGLCPTRSRGPATSTEPEAPGDAPEEP